MSRGRIVLALALLLPACAGSRGPLLAETYAEAARQSDLERNPIIVIPGILGSTLVDEQSGETVWGAFLGDFANPARDAGLRAFALPMGRNLPLSALRDDAIPTGVLSTFRLRLFGLPFEQRAYANILRNLGVGGYRDNELGESGAIDYGGQHFTCYQFPYDWRRDNAENAARLHAFILEKRAEVRAELRSRFGVDRPDLRFDLVAHSMGGLVSRYYLRYGAAPLPEDGSLPELTWEGASLVDQVILIGTPNGGSVQSLQDLVEGVGYGPLLPRYPAAAVGSLPSVYQLLPRPRHASIVDAGGVALDVYDPQIWVRHGWGLASPDADPGLRALLPEVESAAERREIALDHLAKSLARARQFAAALDRPTAAPPHAHLQLFAGAAEPTPSVLRVGAEGGLEVAETSAGDGVVTRASAVMDERVGAPRSSRLRTPIDWQNITFLAADHLGMTRDPAFTDNLLFMLLEKPDLRP